MADEAKKSGGYGPGGGHGQGYGQGFNRGPRGGNAGGGGNFGGNRRRRNDRDNEGSRDDLAEKVLFINRASKVVKGGRRFSFSALVVCGDKQGKVGLGLGKGNEVVDSIRKGSENAKVSMQPIALANETIPHEVYAEYGGAKVLLRPASPGTGLICGKTVRAVVESAGVKNVLSKSLGSTNAANVAKATLAALLQLRTREQIYRARGIEDRLKKAL